MRNPRPLPRLAFLLLFACAGSFAQQLSPIGLSEVRAQWFPNQGLTGFPPAVGDRLAEALAAGDFNGDGVDDLAIGMPQDDDAAAGCDACGAVVVRWGIPGLGLDPAPSDTILHQGLFGSPSAPGSAERFGAALAAGDFNGDGYDDLAVGAPGDGIALSGAVQIYYGWSTGFQTEHSEWMIEADAGGPEHFCGDAGFGAALSVGNFDHDAYDDLAVGAPRACQALEGGGQVRGGAVFVAHGQDFGLLPFYGYRISQDEVDMQDTVEVDDLFGRAVAAGDLSPDSYDDLAIGVPGEDGSGMLQILFGSEFGLLFATNVIWLPGAVGEVPEAGDRFGWALGVGDFDADLHEDLAIGTPLEDLGSLNDKVDAGSIVVTFGSSGGMDLSRTLALRQGTIYGSEPYDFTGDHFGQAFAVGDFDSDGFDDLAVGHPGDNVSSENAGAVTVLSGGPGSALGERHRLLSPGREGIPENDQANQDFGHALAAGDFDGDGYAELAIGAPWFNITGVTDAGGVTVLYGALFADGFEIESFERWTGWEPLP